MFFLLAVLYISLLADLTACRHVIKVKILTELRAMLSKQTSVISNVFKTLVEVDFLLNLLLLCRHVQFVKEMTTSQKMTIPLRYRLQTRGKIPNRG